VVGIVSSSMKANADAASLPMVKSEAFNVSPSAALNLTDEYASVISTSPTSLVC